VSEKKQTKRVKLIEINMKIDSELVNWFFSTQP